MFRFIFTVFRSLRTSVSVSLQNSNFLIKVVFRSWWSCYETYIVHQAPNLCGKFRRIERYHSTKIGAAEYGKLTKMKADRNKCFGLSAFTLKERPVAETLQITEWPVDHFPWHAVSEIVNPLCAPGDQGIYMNLARGPTYYYNKSHFSIICTNLKQYRAFIG